MIIVELGNENMGKGIVTLLLEDRQMCLQQVTHKLRTGPKQIRLSLSWQK